MEQFLQVGVITSTHGLRGEVKVFPTTDDPARFLQLKDVILEGKRGRLDLTVERVKFFKQFAIVKFKGLDRIEDVESYVKCPLLVTRENAVPLEEGEYFIADLIGLRVVTDEGEEFGVLTDVLQTGANDVYVVDHHGAEVLLPVTRECVLDVDVEGGFVTVHILKGLLD